MSGITKLAILSNDKPCFPPLQNTGSKTPADWDTLVKHTYSGSYPPGMKSVQKINDDGYGGRINLDYFGLTFEAPADQRIGTVFQQLRRELTKIIFAGERNKHFKLYEGRWRTSLTPKQLKANANLWASDNPVGALMNFRLHNPISATCTPGDYLCIVREEGDILVTCSSATSVIFTTVQTEENGYHPVSGNRGFGLKDNADGTWSFYTMGADRLSLMGSAISRLPETDYFGLPNMFPDIFDGGKLVWVKMMKNMTSHLSRQKIKVRGKPVINSELYRYKDGVIGKMIKE